MYGCTREEVLSAQMDMVAAGIPPYTTEEAFQLIRKASAGKPQLFEWLSKDITGRLFWIEVNLKRTLIGGKECVLAVVRDITRRKQAEEALKESENKYRTIFETTGTATVILEEDMTISLVNLETVKLSGYSKEELEGKKSWTEFVAKDDLEIMRKYHRLRRIDPNSAPRNYEFRLIDRQGDVKDILLTIDMIPGTKKSVASFLNITERKKTEKAFRESEARLNRIADNMLDIISQTDIEGVYQYVSPSHKDVLGYELNCLLGKPVFEFVHPDDLETVLIAAKRGRETKTPGKLEYRYRHANGHYLWLETIGNLLFDHNGQITGAIFCGRDITERKRTEEKLRLSEERFFKIFNASPSLMAITTFTEGRFIDVNERFLQVMGYRREELIGRTSTGISIWGNPERAEMIKILHDKGMINNLECVFRKKSGEVYTGLYSAEIVDFNGEQFILSVINDITERKRLEEEMARLERLNLIGEMAAGIGHEIRNPMTTVRGFLQLLGGKKECAQFNRYYELMIEELDRANSIITEFLSLAKKKTLSKKAQNLNPIVGALLPLIQADATRAEKYVKTTLGDTPDLLLDEKEIRQLILNLVRNGLEAMSPGGYINIRTYLNGQNVVLAVDDQGKGIDPEVLEKIGTPFFTTKDSGTGLGLAVCYSIAARHEATIEVETSPRGSTFYINFKLPDNTAVA
jgi:PAS domain S-box-containing protein